jgi:hypothetical protein
MNARSCAKRSAALLQKALRDREIGKGNIIAALSYRVTLELTVRRTRTGKIRCVEEKKQ